MRAFRVILSSKRLCLGFPKIFVCHKSILKFSVPGPPEWRSSAGQDYHSASWLVKQTTRSMACRTANAACIASESGHYVKTHSIHYFVRCSNDVITHNIVVAWGWRKLWIIMLINLVMSSWSKLPTMLHRNFIHSNIETSLLVLDGFCQ